jgi:transposase
MRKSGSGYKVGVCGSFTLFAGADTGCERAAAIYSLIGTAKLNGVDPEAWLRYVIAYIADHPVNRVDEFLLWHCAGRLPPP